MDSSKKTTCFTIKKHDIVNKKRNNLDIDDNIPKFYEFPKSNILVEYYHTNGEFSIFSDNGDDTLSAMCIYIKSSDNDIVNIYTENGVYSADIKESKPFYISYTSSNYFRQILNFVHKNKSTPLISFKRLGISLYATNHHIPIMLDGKLISSEISKSLYKNFKTLYNKYSLLSNYIPANSIISNILTSINKYIATRKLDNQKLLEEYINLQNFQDICYDSIARISPFIENPSKVDLRDLTESLQKNTNNISRLINIHLENDKER